MSKSAHQVEQIAHFCSGPHGGGARGRFREGRPAPEC